jgi:hypothetical protein
VDKGDKVKPEEANESEKWQGQEILRAQYIFLAEATAKTVSALIRKSIHVELPQNLSPIITTELQYIFKQVVLLGAYSYDSQHKKIMEESVKEEGWAQDS